MNDLDPQTGSPPPRNGVERIEIQVRRVDDLFQSFDPAPMERRRVAVGADAYVSERASEMPESRSFRLSIRLPEGESGCCQAVERAFQSHFASAATKLKSSLRNHFRVAWKTFFAAVVIALALVFLSQAIAGIAETPLVNKIANGLSIAVWVVLWRPFEMLIHDWRPIDRAYRLYRRLEGIEVECVAE